MCNLVSVKKWYPETIINHIKHVYIYNYYTYIIRHETLNANCSMINFYARYVYIRVATEKTIVALYYFSNYIFTYKVI